MTKQFTNTYIEISKLGVFPALQKNNNIYLTKETMTRVALIYGNSMYCEAIIDEDEYKLNGPMSNKTIPIIEVPKEFKTETIEKIVKIPTSWSYQKISKKEYVKKNTEKVINYQKRYNKIIEKLKEELKILKISTPKLCHNSNIGIDEIIDVRLELEENINNINKLKL